MKMIIKKYIFALLAFCLGLTGCGNWLDVNDNPNTAEKVETGYLFNFAAVLWSGSRMSGDLYIPVAHSLQLQADGDRWAFRGSYYEFAGQEENTWKRYYITVGNNLQLAIQQLQADELRNAEAQCKILLALQLYEATLLYGDVPFSEAWKTEIKYPKFDAQKDVLNGVIALLDEALALIDLGDKNCIDDYDPYFEGDISKWEAVANSFKFRTLMVMADAAPEKAVEIEKMIMVGGMVSDAAGNMLFKYSQTAGNENPKYTLLTQGLGGYNLFFFAHTSVLDPMQQYNDSRIPRYFTALSDGTYKGLATQEYWLSEGMPISSPISDYLYRADCPDLIYSYQEQLFLEAEVYARGLGVGQDLRKANELFRKGVWAACNYYLADATQTEVFIEGLPDLSTLTAEEALYHIRLQQWIDLMDRPLEAFVQWRRSGNNGKEVPELSIPPLNSVPGLIRRWPYPAEELNTNSNAPKESPKLWEPMWFDL